MKKIKYILQALFCLTILVQPVIAQEGLITVKSAHNVATTGDKLVGILEEKGMNVFARIDHAAGAASVGKSLDPIEVVIFGNPKIGTGLMKCAPSVGIDLPMKMLIWESDGATWLGYNAAAYLKSRHDLNGCDGVIEKVTGALAKFAKAATAP